MHQQQIKARISLEIFQKPYYGKNMEILGDIMDLVMQLKISYYGIHKFLKWYPSKPTRNLPLVLCPVQFVYILKLGRFLSTYIKPSLLRINKAIWLEIQALENSNWGVFSSELYMVYSVGSLPSRAPLSIASPNLLVGLFISCILKLLLPEKALWRSEHKTYLSFSVVYDYCYCLVHHYFELERKIYNLYLPPDLDWLYNNDIHHLRQWRPVLDQHGVHNKHYTTLFVPRCTQVSTWDKHELWKVDFRHSWCRSGYYPSVGLRVDLEFSICKMRRVRVIVSCLLSLHKL